MKKAKDAYKEEKISGKFVYSAPVRPGPGGNFREIAVFEEKDGTVTWYLYSESDGFFFPHKARDLDTALSKAECLGYFEHVDQYRGHNVNWRKYEPVESNAQIVDRVLFTESKKHLREECSTSEETDESILDKQFFWLRMHGIWCIDIDTEAGYHFSFYANDMDPSKWFGQLCNRRHGDGHNHSIYDIHSKNCYSELGKYDSEDCSWHPTPRDRFESTPYGDQKIIKVQANKPSIDLDTAVTYGVTVAMKKKLCKLSWKAAADCLIRDEINKATKPYGKKDSDGYRTEYPNVESESDWELVDKLVDETVENIKIAKKAAAEERRAARNALYESMKFVNEKSPEEFKVREAVDYDVFYDENFDKYGLILDGELFCFLTEEQAKTLKETCKDKATFEKFFNSVGIGEKWLNMQPKAACDPDYERPTGDVF